MFVLYDSFSHYLTKQLKEEFVEVYHQIQQVEANIKNNPIKLFLHREFGEQINVQLYSLFLFWRDSSVG